MKIEQTNIVGALVFTPKVHGDSRGYFFESFNAPSFDHFGITRPFVQDNESYSSYGILRGLHFQYPPYEQAKLVRVVEGTVLDIIVDLRKDSPSFLQSFSVELSAENKKQLYAPRGMAHGFVTLSEKARFLYKCDQVYTPLAEGGVKFDDETLKLDWKLSKELISLSARDLAWGTIQQALEKYTCK